MNRKRSIVLATLVVAAGLISAVAFVGSAAAEPSPGAQTLEQQASTNQSNVTPSPGAVLGGAVAAHQVELDGEIEQRSFGLQIAAAQSNESAAATLADVQDRLQNRSAALEGEFDELDQQRANMSEARYHAEATRLATEAQSLEGFANVSERTAGTMPSEVLTAQGVNVTAIQELRNHAQTTSGPEVAAIARSIAGPSMGQAMGPPTSIPGGPGEVAPGQHGPQMGQGPTMNDSEIGPQNYSEMGPQNDSETAQSNDSTMGPTTESGDDTATTQPETDTGETSDTEAGTTEPALMRTDSDQ